MEYQVGINIKPKKIFSNNEISLSDNCTEGDLRLVGGRSPNEGRLEICLNEQWGTVCHDYWSAADASVACRQLEFLSAGR